MTTNITSYWNLWVGILATFSSGNTHSAVTMLKSKPFRRTRNSLARNGSPTSVPRLCRREIWTTQQEES